MSTPKTAVEFLWRAAGCPTPMDPSGKPVPRRHVPAGARCAATDLPAEYSIDDALSDNFTTVKNAGRAWPFGGPWLSPAAVWCARSLALRCSLFFATLDGGFWFEAIRPLPGIRTSRRASPIDALLNPPPAPFVAGLPLYGIDHGGEANAERCVWWDRDGSPFVPAGPWSRREDASKPDGPTRVVDKPLIKLQSKHTAIYCRVATSSSLYPLQVDDTGEVMVDVELWTRLRPMVEEIMLELRKGGLGVRATHETMITLAPPFGGPIRLLSQWDRVTGPLRQYAGSTWWKLFVTFIPVPGVEASA